MVDAENEFFDHTEPVYLLSLDGGGVRGISEAVMLHEIMTRLQKELGLKKLPKPCDYFHLIGGTSTGGLIAIMLGRLRMSTQEVLDNYSNIAEKIFNKGNRRFDRTFREGMLERVLKEVIDPRADGNSCMAQGDSFQKGQSFVVASRIGNADENIPHIFRSYECQGKKTECQIWEAARATTAAPLAFKPAKVKIGIEDESFVDGAVKWNNPSEEVVAEAEALFGPHRRLGCLISLGTGIRPPALKKKTEKRGRLGTNYSIRELITMTANYLTDPEPIHRKLENRLGDHPDSYFRFSVPYVPGDDKVKIFEYQKMGALRLSTEKYLAERDVSEKFDEIVDILCRKRATDLTLYSLRYASTLETDMKVSEHDIAKKEKTSNVFTGRGDVLRKLDHVFAPREPGSYPRRDFLLWGIGGVGKTQIALRFIDSFADRFDEIIRIDASDIHMIHHSFELIAVDKLKHPGEAPHIRPVLNWLNNTKKEWLLVIDNYDDGDITRYLPDVRKGNILFTSRRHDLRPHLPAGSMLEVSEMSVLESTRLLLRACRFDEDDEELHEQAHPIVKELGGLPLALNAAGAHINVTTCSFDKYLSDLREKSSQVLAEAPPGSEASKNPGVYTTFELSFDSLKSFSRGSSDQALLYRSALQILNTFCFYHRENIPAELIFRANAGIKLSKGWEDIGLKSEPVQGPDAPVILGIRGGAEKIDHDYVLGGLMLLVRFSLIKEPMLLNSPTDLQYSMHTLIHSWLRDRMRRGVFDKNLKLARSILYHSYHPRLRHSTAERYYRSLLPHMKAINSHQFKVEDDTPFGPKMEIRWKYLQILKRSRLWDEAIPLLKKDIGTLSSEFDPNDWETIELMVDLGEAYMATDRIKEAETLLHEVIDRVGLCSNQAFARKCYLRACGSLSMAHLLQGDLGLAKLAAERGVKYGKTHGIVTLYAMSRLCLVYQYVERWEDARELADAILNDRPGRRSRDPMNHETLKAEAELARIRARLGDVDAAEEVLVKVAQKFEEDLGKDHYDTLVARTNLAWVYFVQLRLGEAEVIQREILKTAQSVLGPHHLYTLYMMLRLGLTLGESGKHRMAIEVLDECVAGRELVLNDMHLAVAGVLIWRTVYANRRVGCDYREGLSEANVEQLERAKKLAEHPWTAVQTY